MILVLKGGRNKGKTSAIRKAYDLLLEMGKKHNIIKNVISVNPSTTRGLPKKDLAATLELVCPLAIRSRFLRVYLLIVIPSAANVPQMLRRLLLCFAAEYLYFSSSSAISYLAAFNYTTGKMDAQYHSVN